MKKKSNLTVSLHEELIVEILLRLPTSSLLRFKSVCKSWRSLICNSQFAKSHFDLAAAPSYRFLNRETVFDDFFESINLNDEESVVSLRLPLPPPEGFSRHGSIKIRGSCRGFVLLHFCETDNLVVWNPSTGTHKPIPNPFKIIEGSSTCEYGFGYDASSDDYLVILNKFPTQIMFFSFKTNSWNYMEIHDGKAIAKENEQYSNSLSTGLFLNGALHWLHYSFHENVYVIIEFDLEQRRTLSEIPLPLDTAEAYLLELHRVGGYLGVWCFFHNRRELWVRKEYEVLSSWTKLDVMPSSSLTNDDNASCIYLLMLEPIRGKVIVSNYRCPGLKEFTDKINQEGLCEHLTDGGGQVLCCQNLQRSMYRESLLSLPSESG